MSITDPPNRDVRRSSLCIADGTAHGSGIDAPRLLDTLGISSTTVDLPNASSEAARAGRLPDASA